MKKQLLTIGLLLIISQTTMAALSAGNVQVSPELNKHITQTEASKKMIESASLSFDDLVQLYKEQYQESNDQVRKNELSVSEKKLDLIERKKEKESEILKLKAKIKALKSFFH